MSPPLNYRDVGEALGLWLDPSPLRTGRLFRGGRLDELTTAADLRHPATILNLRRGADEKLLAGVRYLHVPASDELENYDTSQRKVRAWLREALSVLASPKTAWPVYLHCTSGRDRTGLVIAAALLLLDIPPEIVVEEYLLSDGATRGPIVQAVRGILASGGTLGVNPKNLRTALL
ncbi:MAG TPA: tyrosine-protein phosphatase [Gemmatimonadales bacterium]|jgi:protein-tyrosine phosphatase|nr:tyrosine-protein phosphatase [Gemmatimonadales bacterium]